ncbi:MAG: tetratricopeptide repeat protein [Zoogloeaceae bacterium]|nr:tetratricopeptide repeat protein [Zoogloeaceae bacterium]
MTFKSSARLCLAFLCCIFCAQLAQADDDAYRNALRLLSEGRIEEAQSTLNEVVAQQPEHAGAWLDLAIMQCSLGMVEEAEKLFNRILERFDPPPAIQELIRQIRARGCQREKPELLTALQLRMGVGYDNNANQGASNRFSLSGLPLAPEFHPMSDSFTQLALESSALSPRHGISVYTQLQTRQYSTLSRYNLTSGVVVMEKALRAGGWEGQVGATLGGTRLGSHLYQKHIGTHAQLFPPWPILPAGWRYSFVSDFSRVWYPTLENFDADIWRNQLVLNFRNSRTQFMGSVGVLQDFGNPERPGGDKRGWTASLNLRRQLGNLVGELSLASQDWQGDTIYFSSLPDTNVKRKQRTHLWRAALAYPVNAQNSLILEYRDLNNKENIALFSYRSKQIMLNWQYVFGR